MLSTQPWLNLPAARALGFSVNTTDRLELARIEEQLLKTRPTLLGFDDSTFASRLVSGEAAMAVSWDGACNVVADKRVKFVVPIEGADLWADVMVVPKSSRNKEAAMAYLNFMIATPSQTWMTTNLLYKSPHRAVAEQTAKEFGADYPNLAMTPAELAQGETLVDVGNAVSLYDDIARTVVGP